MLKQNDTIGVGVGLNGGGKIQINSIYRPNIAEDWKMDENIQIKEVDGTDIVQYKPSGVCCKLMQMRIKNDIIEDVEFFGGCNGNLKGIGILIRGMNINDIIPKLSGLPCGSRPTSCPDQLTKGIEAYLEAKKAAAVS